MKKFKRTFLLLFLSFIDKAFCVPKSFYFLKCPNINNHLYNKFRPKYSDLLSQLFYEDIDGSIREIRNQSFPSYFMTPSLIEEIISDLKQNKDITQKNIKLIRDNAKNSGYRVTEKKVRKLLTTISESFYINNHLNDLNPIFPILYSLMNFKKNNVFLSDSDLKKRKVITNDHINKVIEDKRHKFWFYYFHNIYFSKDKTLPLLFQYNKSTPDAQTISPYPDLCRNSTFKFLPIFTF